MGRRQHEMQQVATGSNRRYTHASRDKTGTRRYMHTAREATGDARSTRGGSQRCKATGDEFEGSTNGSKLRQETPGGACMQRERTKVCDEKQQEMQVALKTAGSNEEQQQMQVALEMAAGSDMKQKEMHACNARELR